MRGGETQHLLRDPHLSLYGSMFLSRFSAIVAFLHQAYLESDLNLSLSREPYERFEKFNTLIDTAVRLDAEIEEDGNLSIRVTLPGKDFLEISTNASRFLYQMDRQAYVEALNAAKSAPQVPIEAEE